MPYSTTTELQDYATQRGITLTGDLSALLYRANDWIEAQSYYGTKTDSTQTTQFPRDGVYIDGELVDSTTVPLAIKKAEMQMAIEIDKGNDPYQAISRQAIRQKVDKLEVEYSDKASAINTTIIRSVRPLLKGFVQTDGIRVTQGA